MEVVDESRFEELTAQGGCVVVDFFATWCQPCKMLGSLLESVQDEYPHISFVKVDIDQSPELASKHEVMSVPTVLFFKGGQQVQKMVGFKNKTFVKEQLDKLA